VAQEVMLELLAQEVMLVNQEMLELQEILE
jgi:hypothetical protein